MTVGQSSDQCLTPTCCWREQVDSYARVADSIVGWGSKLGPWSRLENHAVVGEDVTVRPEVRHCRGWGCSQGSE